MELLSVIRRWHYRDRLPIREIERRTMWAVAKDGAYVGDNSLVTIRYARLQYTPEGAKRLADQCGGRVVEVAIVVSEVAPQPHPMVGDRAGDMTGSDPAA